ncbi:MAG: response regulator [Bacteroidales bacterium]
MKNKINAITTNGHNVFNKELKIVAKNLETTKINVHPNSGQELIELLNLHNPDVILMDIKVPVTDGIKATKGTLQKNPELKVVALSLYNKIGNAQNKLEVISKGFLLKNTKKEELDIIINSISKNEKYYSKEILNYL